MKANLSIARRFASGRLIVASVILAAATLVTWKTPAMSSTSGGAAPSTAAERSTRQAKAPDAKPVLPVSQSPVKPDTLQRRIIAYYFHTTQRCVSCRKLEAWSREAIEGVFADELKTARLVWQVVNIEEKGNEHFVKDYQLYTKSLVLVDQVKGRQVAWKNLEKVWQLLQDKPAFLRYVQDETRAYLTPRS